MKNLLLFCMLVCCFWACNQSTSTPEAAAETPATEATAENGGPLVGPDLVAITDVIHNFYKWYEANLEAVTAFNYIKGGMPAKLDQAQLDGYYALLLKTGLISQAYVDDDRAYLKNLEATAWKNENVEEGPLSGLDYDRFFCAQDYDFKFWTAAPVEAKGLGTDRVEAILSGDEGGSPRTQKFELKKENGKWLIAKIVCAQ